MSAIKLEWLHPDAEGWHLLRATRKGALGAVRMPFSALPVDSPAKILIDSCLSDHDGVPVDRAEILFDDQSKDVKARPAFLAALDFRSAEALGLPPPLPLAIDFKSKGAMLDSNFHVVPRFVSGGGAPARVDVRGALALYNGRSYRLPSLLFNLYEAVEGLRQPVVDQAVRIERLARLKSAIPDDLADALSDGYIRDIRILYAATMSLSLIPKSDGMTFDPILFGRSVAEVSTGEELIDEEAHALLTPVEQEIFSHKGFRNSPNARAAYSVGRNTFVYVDPALRPVLDLVRRTQDADPEIRKRFAMSPRTYIREALNDADESLVDALFIETEQFSQRVSGIDIWRKPVLPWIKPKSNSWLPESFGFLLGDVSIALTVQLARKLYRDLTEAHSLRQGSIQFEVEGQVLEIAVTEQAITTAKDLACLAERMEEAGERGGGKADEQGEELKRFLVVKDNLDVETYIEDAPDRDDRPPFRLELPVCLRASLKEHQTAGLAWLEQCYAHDLPGALLADDMGLGKTLQALCALAWRWERGREGKRPAKPSLIVAPTGLLNNWRDEIERHLAPGTFGDVDLAFGPHLKRLRSGTGTRDTSFGASTLDVSQWMQAGLVMTTFETLRDYHMSFARVPFAMVVFDEAQKAKNPASQLTRAAKTLNAELRLAMTGTPVENRLQDLWSIADVAWPGRLGSSQGFARAYPETEPEKLKALNRNITDPGPAGRPPFMLRRLKRDKLDGLPSKTIRRYDTPMPPAQADAYRRAVLTAVASRTGMSPGDGMLRTLHELRQISFHPGFDAASAQLESWAQNSARIRTLLSILDEVSAASEKALIFLEFLEAQQVLSALLEHRFGFRPECINGATPGDRRQAIVKRFQDSKRPFNVLILSPKAGGVGLTLTAANHVIHLTRWWNPAVEDQATDRVYRIGQQRPVTVHLPMAVHPEPDFLSASFDLKLDALLERKRALSQDLLMPVGGDEGDIRHLFEGILGAAPELTVPQESPDPHGKSPPPPTKDDAPVASINPVAVGEGRSRPRPSSSGSAQSIWRYHYAAGQERSLREILKPLAAQPILAIELQDPYCMTLANRPLLIGFLSQVRAQTGPISSIKVWAWSPESRKIRGQSHVSESEGAAKHALRQALPDDLRVGTELILKLERRPDRDFHDRWARFQVGGEGSAISYVLDLSGGVDRFMSSHREIVATLSRVD